MMVKIITETCMPKDFIQEDVVIILQKLSKFKHEH